VPNSAEAQTLIESDSGASQWNDEEARHLRQKITETLLKHNPRLKPFGLNNENANHVELNPPKDDLVIQITVYWDHVFLTIPYWYSGAKAHEVFGQLSAYLRVIREAVGFFAYDPQTSRAFDPLTESVGNSTLYEQITNKSARAFDISQPGGRRETVVEILVGSVDRRMCFGFARNLKS
jgi:hypothetical protein